MDINKVSSTPVAIKWGTIYVVTSIVITYAIQFLNLDPNSPVKYLSFIPFIAFLLLAQKEYKSQLDGYITFSEAFKTGFVYAIFAGVILAVFTYLYLSILSPEILDKALAVTETKLAEKGLTQEQIDHTIEMARKFGPIGGAIGSILGGAIMGAIVSLIGAAIFKNERLPVAITDNDEQASTDPTI